MATLPNQSRAGGNGQGARFVKWGEVEGREGRESINVQRKQYCWQLPKGGLVVRASKSHSNIVGSNLGGSMQAAKIGTPYVCHPGRDSEKEEEDPDSKPPV